MRPIRITGITGTSPPVPLDVYVTDSKTVATLTGAGAVQMTIDDIFNLSITPFWNAAPAAVNGLYDIPEGVRAIQATGMAPADVFVISQQGIT
jgi:hypothetical protein